MESKIFKAPIRMGIIMNPEETYIYFNAILSYILSNSQNQRIVFDLKECTYVGIDSVLYMLSMARDININTEYHLKYSIILPDNQRALNYLKKSGLYDYLENIDYEIGDNKFGIRHGIATDQDIAEKVSEFVLSNCNINLSTYSEIYELIIELMINTLEHASFFEKGIYLKKEWYVYCEIRRNHIHIFFLDTGVGIPRTIRKKYDYLIEKQSTDSDLINDAIFGMFQINGRGNGLPHIKTLLDMENAVSKIDVCSGNGMVTYSKLFQNRKIKFNFENKMYGTFIHIVIKKEMEEEIHDKNKGFY